MPADLSGLLVVSVEQAVADLDDMDGTEKRRLEYFSRQIVDMFAPTNFLGTNPEALAKAVETDGLPAVEIDEEFFRRVAQTGRGCRDDVVQVLVHPREVFRREGALDDAGAVALHRLAERHGTGVRVDSF